MGLHELPARSLCRGNTVHEPAFALSPNGFKEGYVLLQTSPRLVTQVPLVLDVCLGNETFSVAGAIFDECAANVTVERYRHATQHDTANLDRRERHPASPDAGACC